MGWLQHSWEGFRRWGMATASNPTQRRLVVMRNVLMGLLAVLGFAWMGVWMALGQWVLLSVSGGLMLVYLLFLRRLNRRPAAQSLTQWVNLFFLWASSSLFADVAGPQSTLHLWVAFSSTTALIFTEQINYRVWALQSLVGLTLATVLYFYPHTFFGPLELSKPQQAALTLGAQLTLLLTLSLAFVAEREAHRWAAARADHAQRVQQQQSQLLGLMEQDRAIAQRNLLALLDGSAAMLLLIDREGRIVAFNDIFSRYAYKIDGRQPRVGHQLFKAQSRFDTQEIRKLTERALAGESVRVYKTVTDRQGRSLTYDIHLKPVQDEGGEVWGVVFSAIDVTEQEKDRLRLERSESNLQSLLDNSPDIIWSVDREYRLLTINEGFNRYLETNGFPRQQVGDCLLDPFPEWVQQYWIGLYQRAFNGESFTEELSSEWQGKMIYLELRLSPIVHSNGEITGALVQMRVVNERKAMEQQLIKTKEEAELANAVKSRFLAHISHELRNPVHAILGFVGLLRQPGISHPNALYDLLARAARRLSDSLENLLDYNLLDSGQLRLQLLDFDLEQLLNDCAVLYIFTASQKGLTFETHITPLASRWVVGDRVRLQRIIDSLVDNALKFTTVGTISLRVWQELCAEGQLMLHLRLTDTGEGMPPDVVQHIYEPFVQGDSSTTKQVQGLGLGLSVVHQLVNLMGGSIDVQSTPGVGTCIDLQIPLAPSTRSSTEPLTAEPLPQASQRPLRVLLAEDDEANAHYIEELLRGLGWTVHWVLNGRQALRQLERETYDVLLLDGAMPVMDGIATVEHIRQQQAQNPDYPRLPILVVSGYARGPERDRFLQLGVDAFLTKPVQSHDLVAAILKAVGERTV